MASANFIRVLRLVVPAAHKKVRHFSWSATSILRTHTLPLQQPHLSDTLRAAFSSITSGDDHIFDIEGDEDFQEKVVSSPTPVLVDFYADWCGPCKLLGPRLEAKVTSREGQLSLAKVNVDFATDVADDFEITAVPTIIAFKDGQPIGRFEGNLNDQQLDEVIEELLEQSTS